MTPTESVWLAGALVLVGASALWLEWNPIRGWRRYLEASVDAERPETPFRAIAPFIGVGAILTGIVMLVRAVW